MIPAPVFDDGAYVPQLWERLWPDGRVTTETENPTAFSGPQCAALARIANGIEKGFLPWPGTYMQQPAKMLSGLHIWRDAVDACFKRIEQRGGGEK